MDCRPRDPFWVAEPTLAHFNKLLFNTPYPERMWDTVVISVLATFHVARRERLRCLRHRAAAVRGSGRPGSACDPEHRCAARAFQHQRDRSAYSFTAPVMPDT